jgi:hypothetical protein
MFILFSLINLIFFNNLLNNLYKLFNNKTFYIIFFHHINYTMNQTSIILIIVLLSGIILFSFLGEKMKEGMQGTFNGTFNTILSGNSGSNELSSNKSSGASTSSGVNFDNYNHFTQSSSNLASGTTFYGKNGGNVVVNTNSDGTQTLTVTLANGQSPIQFNSVQPSVSKVENYTNYTTGKGGTANTFYGPLGDQATIITTAKGQQAVNVQTPEGAYTFTESGEIYNPNNTSNTMSSTQYYGSTGSPIQTSSNYNGGSITGPQDNTAYYATGPNGNTAIGTSNTTQNNASTNSNIYSNALPTGIPKSAIPAGDEDLYILKSEVWPPVCPGPVILPAPTDKKCPPCAPCARCPEPSMTCKAVPNYNAINDNNLPNPVLNDFSSFGM